MAVTSLPRKVGLGWLVPLALADIDLRLTFHVRPREPKDVRRQFQKRYTQAVTSLALKQKRGRTDTDRDQPDREDLERLLQRTIRGTTKLYDVAIYLELVADSRDELGGGRSPQQLVGRRNRTPTATVKDSFARTARSVLSTIKELNISPILYVGTPMKQTVVEPTVADVLGEVLDAGDDGVVAVAPDPETIEGLVRVLGEDTPSVRLLADVGALKAATSDFLVAGRAANHVGEDRKSVVGKECSEPCRSRWSPYH